MVIVSGGKKHSLITGFVAGFDKFIERLFNTLIHGLRQYESVRSEDHEPDLRCTTAGECSMVIDSVVSGVRDVHEHPREYDVD